MNSFTCVYCSHLCVTNELATRYCSKTLLVLRENVLSSLIYVLLFAPNMNKVYCDKIVVFTHLMYARSDRPPYGRFTSWNHISLWHSLVKTFVSRIYTDLLCKHNYWTIIPYEWNAIDYACFFNCLNRTSKPMV